MHLRLGFVLVIAVAIAVSACGLATVGPAQPNIEATQTRAVEVAQLATLTAPTATAMATSTPALPTATLPPPTATLVPTATPALPMPTLAPTETPLPPTATATATLVPPTPVPTATAISLPPTATHHYDAPAPASPIVFVAPEAGPAGTRFTFDGRNFPAGVIIEWAVATSAGVTATGTFPLGPGQTAFLFTFTTDGLAPGTYNVVFKQLDGQLGAFVSFGITAPSRQANPTPTPNRVGSGNQPGVFLSQDWYWLGMPMPAGVYQIGDTGSSVGFYVDAPEEAVFQWFATNWRSSGYVYNPGIMVPQTDGFAHRYYCLSNVSRNVPGACYSVDVLPEVRRSPDSPSPYPGLTLVVVVRH